MGNIEYELNKSLIGAGTAPGTGSGVVRVEDSDPSMSYPDGGKPGSNAKASNGTFVTSSGRVVCTKQWTGTSITITITFISGIDDTFPQPIEVYVGGDLVGEYAPHGGNPGEYTFGQKATFAVPAGTHNGFMTQVKGGLTNPSLANYFDCADLA